MKLLTVQLYVAVLVVYEISHSSHIFLAPIGLFQYRIRTLSVLEQFYNGATVHYNQLVKVPET